MSSDNDLTGIFKLIESSENIVEEKKRVLLEAKHQNQEYLLKLSTIRKVNKESRDSLEELESEFARVEQKCSYLQMQCCMINEQKAILCKTIDLTRNKLCAVGKVISDIRKEFKETSNSFLSKYDVNSKWLAKRKMEVKNRLSIVMSDVKEINKGIKYLENKNCERISSEKKLEEMRKIYRNKVEATEGLVSLKNNLSDFPNNDAYCKRLYDELKEIKEQNLKDQCRCLSRELKLLQDQYVSFVMPRHGC